MRAENQTHFAVNKYKPGIVLAIRLYSYKDPKFSKERGSSLCMSVKVYVLVSCLLETSFMVGLGWVQQCI